MPNLSQLDQADHQARDFLRGFALILVQPHTEKAVSSVGDIIEQIFLHSCIRRVGVVLQDIFPQDFQGKPWSNSLIAERASEFENPLI